MHWIIEAALKILPAAIANMTPTLLSKFNILGLRKPIDGGALFFDGNRLLGDGKTWQGLIFGSIAGAVVGFILFGNALIGFLQGFGALLGDITGSFIKRRLGLKRGDEIWLLDSLNFLPFPIIFTHPWLHFTEREILLYFFAAPLIHRLSNVIGFVLGLKKVPW